jgi:transposase-like protein
MLYSLDLRIRVINAVKSGGYKVEICRVFNICRQTIYHWINLELTQGNLLPISGSKNLFIIFLAI